MNFEDLREQLTEKLQNLWMVIQDNPTYISLREKFDTLPPNLQKATMALGALLVLLGLLIIPMFQLSTANEYISEFEENQRLIRELLSTKRKIDQAPKLQIPLMQGALKARADSNIQRAGLVSDQVSPADTIDVKMGSLGPKNLITSAVKISLKKLNLSQIVDIGYELQTMNDTVKMVGLHINADDDKENYFNVDYQLATFSLPREEKKEENIKDSRKKRSKRRN